MRTLLSVVAAMLVTSGLALDAAHAKKTREIVVVGSKVKDVIREAGLRSDGELVQAIDREIHRWLQEAHQRAQRNGRKTELAHDLPCLPHVTGRELIVMAIGLRSDGELVQAVSDKVHEMLGAAIHRCTSNGRSTVRPYDL